jgi:hypothetical protein
MTGRLDAANEVLPPSGDDAVGMFLERVCEIQSTREP